MLLSTRSVRSVNRKFYILLYLEQRSFGGSDVYFAFENKCVMRYVKQSDNELGFCIWVSHIRYVLINASNIVI